jgi:hypothetical protein
VLELTSKLGNFGDCFRVYYAELGTIRARLAVCTGTEKVMRERMQVNRYR